MRRDNLLITIAFLDLLQEILETQTESRSFRQPDWQTFSYHIGEHEQLQVFSYAAMVTFLRFFEQRQIFIEHRAFREGNTVDTRHHRTFLVATPVCRSTRKHLDSLDIACTHQVRAFTKVGKVALGISGNRAILQFGD